MCNCSSNPANVCNQCQRGNPCGCPPDYSIMPQPVSCTCCPSGYTFYAPTPNWPNGYCNSSDNPPKQVAPVPCNACEMSLPSDCVILPDIPCLGIPAGQSLTVFLQQLCANPTTFIEFILSSIGLNPILGSGFCQLVQNCPPVSAGTTPLIGTILITYP